MKFLKLFFVSACVLLVLSACVGGGKKTYVSETEDYKRTVTVHHKKDEITKEVYETSAPIKEWGYDGIKEARKALREEKKALKEKYNSLPRGAVKYDFSVNKDETVTQTMTLNINKKNIDPLIEAGLINERLEITDGHVSLKKHDFVFNRAGLKEEK